MPLAKMRSIGPDSLTFWLAPANNSFKLVPDQKTRSNSSLSSLMRLIAMSLRMMADQLAMEMVSKITITTCTTKLACKTRETMDMSWFMAGVLSKSWLECGRV
jgi:hypothetical protein